MAEVTGKYRFYTGATKMLAFRINLIVALAVLVWAITAALAHAGTVESGCVFWEGPDVRPTAQGATGTISECPCVLTGVVKNVGSSPANYVHVLVTFWDTRAGELVHSAWTQVAAGTLSPGQEEFIRFPLGLLDVKGAEYERQVTLRWKNQEYAKEDVECVIDSAITRYDDNLCAQLYGFVKNVDNKAGFVPNLRARVLDEQGRTANIVSATMPRIPLEPGELLPFALSIPAFSPTNSIDLSMDHMG